MGYDPDVGPDPAHWLALEEAERLRQAKDYHECYDTLLAEPEIHAAIHVMIENQIATDDETPAREALDGIVGRPNSTRSYSCPGFGPDRNDRRSRQGRGDGAFARRTPTTTRSRG